MRWFVMYLPQFHETAENNEWWGKVFKLLARKIQIKYLVFRISPLLYTKSIRMYHARNLRHYTCSV